MQPPKMQQEPNMSPEKLVFQSKHYLRYHLNLSLLASTELVIDLSTDDGRDKSAQ
jgi:hypothetical protein